MADTTVRYPRAIRDALLADLQLFPVVAVMGARQVGKSTLCLQVAAELGLNYATLDDKRTRESALRDPEGFLAGLGDNGVFIDEVQRAPQLTLAIKAVVDRDQRNGHFLLSGSNQAEVNSAISDSLLGRVTYRTLRPLTLSELRYSEHHPGWSFLFGSDEDAILRELEERATTSGKLLWRDVVRTGGFPRAISAPPAQRLRVLNDYVTIFANSDARELITVERPDRFEDFVRLAAARTGQELNYSRIGNDLGVSVNTVRRWINVLRRAFLIELIPAFSRNSGERVVKAPKLYMVDAALAMAAARESEPTRFHLETLIAHDLLVWIEADPTRALHHWRLGSGQECDFILEEDGNLVALEVKATENSTSGDGRHLRAFKERHNNCIRGILLTCDPDMRMLQSGLVACPWWAII